MTSATLRLAPARCLLCSPAWHPRMWSISEPRGDRINVLWELEACILEQLRALQLFNPFICWINAEFSTGQVVREACVDSEVFSDAEKIKRHYFLLVSSKMSVQALGLMSLALFWVEEGTLKTEWRIDTKEYHVMLVVIVFFFPLV